MQNGYYATTGAMVTQFNRLDVISNNLANINTTAFKRDDVVVGDFKRIYQDYQEELPVKNNTKEAAKFLNASVARIPQVNEQYIEFNQGGLKQTGNEFDLALKRKDVFFMVETPTGFALTKDGSFMLNDKGVLSTKDGYPVLSNTKRPIKLNASSTFNVDKSGNISSVNLANGIGSGENPIGSLYIAQSSDIKSLTKEGSNIYKFKNINDIKNLKNSNAVAQGFIETSNVNPVKEMVGLIDAQRMVEMYQKVMTSHMNDLNSDAINKLAITRA